MDETSIGDGDPYALRHEVFSVFLMFPFCPLHVSLPFLVRQPYLQLSQALRFAWRVRFWYIPYSFPFRVEHLYLKPRPSVEEPRICDPPRFSSQFPCVCVSLCVLSPLHSCLHQAHVLPFCI